VKRFVIAFLCVVGIVSLGQLLLSPPHYFVVNAGSDFESATIKISDEPATDMFGGYGVFVGQTGLEGIASIALARTDGTKRFCNISYFTSQEIQPHYITLEECDGKWR
jgi:hypothetical protein